MDLIKLAILKDTVIMKFSKGVRFCTEFMLNKITNKETPKNISLSPAELTLWNLPSPSRAKLISRKLRFLINSHSNWTQHKPKCQLKTRIFLPPLPPWTMNCPPKASQVPHECSAVWELPSPRRQKQTTPPSYDEVGRRISWHPKKQLPCQGTGRYAPPSWHDDLLPT